MNNTLEFLNKLLANQHVLYIKTRNAHWNVKGIDFKPAHLFFQDLYESFAEDIDEIAERIRKLDSPVIANLSIFISNSDLISNEPTSFDSKTLYSLILNDLVLINLSIKERINDMQNFEDSEDFGTINFLTNLLEKNEKTIWFLKSSL